MNTKRTIRKILFVLLWVSIGGGMLTLLLAANGNQKKEKCRDLKINIKGSQDNPFVNRSQVLQLLSTEAGGDIKGKPVAGIELRKLEQKLEEHVWIKDAELYFDNQEVLHVTITERTPVARLFTTEGRSFYIDHDKKQMPLSPGITAELPVFTGFPDKKVLTRKDSLLLNEVSSIAEFILKDPFWMSQVAQIDITKERDFEMIPVVGNHLVRLGKGDDIEMKFRRLFLFYKNILSKTGFNTYSTIDVQFAGQVVGVKGQPLSKIDAEQLKKNVEKLMQQARDMEKEVVTMPAAPVKSMTAEPEPVIEPKATLQELPADPNPLKISNDEQPKPKALMPKRNGDQNNKK